MDVVGDHDMQYFCFLGKSWHAFSTAMHFKKQSHSSLTSRDSMTQNLMIFLSGIKLIIMESCDVSTL